MKLGQARRIVWRPVQLRPTWESGRKRRSPSQQVRQAPEFQAIWLPAL
jgi:hypothetical protein